MDDHAQRIPGGESASLYGRLLGHALERLPAALRRFHGRGCGRARGSFAVVRGPGRRRAAACTLLGLPAAGEEVPVELLVTADRRGEHWRRRFGSRRLTSVQRARGALLVERFGPYAFGFRLAVEGETLVYRFERAWLLGCPLPRRLALRSGAVCRGDGAGWQVESWVGLPGLGELVRYSGRVVPA